jgi:hypothetical protein
MQITEIGLEKKNAETPPDRLRDWRKLDSRMGLSTYAASQRCGFEVELPHDVAETKPKRTMRYMSNTELFSV